MPSTKLLTIPRTEVTTDHIMQIGMGFWASKVLMSAVELGVFTYLADTSKTGREIERAVGLHPRGTYDLLDTLVALGLLARDANGSAGRYGNTPRPRRSSIARAHNTSAACSKWRTRGSIVSGLI